MAATRNAADHRNIAVPCSWCGRRTLNWSCVCDDPTRQAREARLLANTGPDR